MWQYFYWLTEWHTELRDVSVAVDVSERFHEEIEHTTKAATRNDNIAAAKVAGR